MDLQATEPLQISDAPIKIPNRIGPLKCRLQRWLDGREHSHLQPVDTNRVLVRPFTPEELRARAERLGKVEKPTGKRPPVYRRPNRKPPMSDSTPEPQPEPIAATLEPEKADNFCTAQTEKPVQPTPPKITARRRRRRSPRKRRQPPIEDLGNLILKWLGLR
jgi:hypothetical protein